MAIKIIVDSSSDINKEEAAKLGVELLPLQILIDGDEYLDGVNLYPDRFYEKLVESEDLPKTSAINPYRFEEAFKKEVDNGNEVIAILLSSKLSTTYSCAVQANKNFGKKVYVIDSLNATVGIRLLVQYALQLIEKGLTIEKIVDELNYAKTKIRLIALVDTLEYLKKGGRISRTVAIAGTILSIKPVIQVADGEVKLIGQARGSKKANNLLNIIIQNTKGIDFSKPYGTVYSGLSDMAVKKYIADNANLWSANAENIPIYIVGCTIGTHVGPGALGVAFFEL